tara:strand:- start:302 stop:523 length:222 start_codon:yes stop_codon:yes gene_type:complete
MSKQKTKKLGYTQYEKLLAQAHQKSDFLAQRYQELQSYILAYVEYRGDKITFDNWMSKRMEELQKKEHVHEEV